MYYKSTGNYEIDKEDQIMKYHRDTWEMTSLHIPQLSVQMTNGQMDMRQSGQTSFAHSQVSVTLTGPRCTNTWIKYL